MMMVSRGIVACALVLALVNAGCDKAQLLAPSGSTVTLTTASSYVPTGGTTQVTAFVAEASGTPVQNGTTVRFSTNLGRVEPVEMQTSNGYATATFVAGDASGVADVRANSGATGGSTSTTEGASNSNVVQITVGAAGVETVVLAANPSTVPAGGGTVDLIASVTAKDGRSLQGIVVTFVASAGRVGSTTVVTDGSGRAVTTLTTDRTTTVKASAGAKTSSEVTITALANVTATLSATGAVPVIGVGQQWTFTATLSPANDTGAQPVSFDWNFGDGATVTTNGNSTAHVYTAGSGQVRQVQVTIRLTNGQTLVAATEILLGVF
jgi:hypothetical protein